MDVKPSDLLVEMGASRLYHGDDRDAGVILVRVPEALYNKIHVALSQRDALRVALHNLVTYLSPTGDVVLSSLLFTARAALSKDATDGGVGK